jgi:hypothetical protein
MNVNDIVRIKTQPANQCAQVEGLVGFIEKVHGDYANFIELPPGKPGGGGRGTVPFDCLELISDPATLGRRNAFFQNRAESIRKHFDYNKQYSAAIARIAEEEGLNPKAILRIYQKVQEIRN